MKIRVQSVSKKLFGDVEKFHFIGIGGIGMSGLAEILLQSGLPVSGSDLQETPITERLQGLGARIHIGHSESNLADAQVVVFSTAVKQTNAELEAARARKRIIIHRSELLAELMRSRQSIAVTGTHGKTTTTSMIALLLLDAGLDPTIVVGGRLKSLQSTARLGQGPYLVCEADESDRSFLKLFPVHAVVTNIDLDHMDYYRDLADLQQCFLEYMNKVPFYGMTVLCLDDPNLRPLLKIVHRRVITYGLNPEAEFSARDIQLGSMRAGYECLHRGQPLGRIELKVGGRHNVQNSLAAVAVGANLNIPFPAIARALGSFEGAERRMEWKGTRDDVWVMDDYGHHPAEVRATLEACKATGRRLVVVFQPHRYSRTQHLMTELGACFEEADRLYLMEIYAAGEAPIPGVTGERLAEEVRRHREVTYVPDQEKIVELLRQDTAAGDLLLTLGAGDVWKIGEAFLAKSGESKS